MFKYLLLVFGIFSSVRAVSQQDHFLYLQSDDRQPFYAKLAGQVHSSSENGYLIIPKLVDGTYQLDIGFAKSAFPEQHFPLVVNKKDMGFQIRNQGDKGWALYNIRNSDMIASNVAVGQKADDYSGTRKTDNFSAMLANVVNDSAILYSAVTAAPPKPVAKVTKPDTTAAVNATQTEQTDVAVSTPLNQQEQNIPIKTDSVQAVNTIDTPAVIVKKDPPKKEESIAVKPVEQPKQTPVQQPEPAVSTATPPVATTAAAPAAGREKPFIIRITESSSNTGYEAIYLEQYNLNTDTVRILISAQESATTAKTTTEPTKQAPVVSTPAPVVKAETTPPAVVKTETVAPKKTTLQVTNSDCKNYATDYDVDKLRVKMMSEYAIEDKIVAAKKVFKTRCFTVKQIRALTELFTSDETRYQFFDAAYPFVSDTSEFQTLESLIIADYYKNRFKAMVHR